MDTKFKVVFPLPVDVRFQDLVQKIHTSGSRPELVAAAQKIFDKVQNIWRPAALYRLLEFQKTKTGTIGRIHENDPDFVDIDFGYSIKFLSPASHVFVSVYTAGDALEQESKKAAQKGDVLAAFFLDLIGLVVLEKAGNQMKCIAQEKAAEMGWGVSPFLSPGSVHGWDLEEQIPLCTLLPLEQINVRIQDNAVLLPFKTISCLIGLGPGYSASKVGTTCQVCSKNQNCQMKQGGTMENRLRNPNAR